MFYTIGICKLVIFHRIFRRTASVYSIDGITARAADYDAAKVRQ